MERLNYDNIFSLIFSLKYSLILYYQTNTGYFWELHSSILLKMQEVTFLFYSSSNKESIQNNIPTEIQQLHNSKDKTVMIHLELWRQKNRKDIVNQKSNNQVSSISTFQADVTDSKNVLSLFSFQYKNEITVWQLGFFARISN